jgi:hypothetical protein
MGEKFGIVKREWRIRCYGADGKLSLCWVDVTRGRVAIGPDLDKSCAENYFRVFKGWAIVEFRDAINEAIEVVEAAKSLADDLLIRCYDIYGELAVCSLGTHGGCLGLGGGPNQCYLYVFQDRAIFELRDAVNEATQVAEADRLRPSVGWDSQRTAWIRTRLSS